MIQITVFGSVVGFAYHRSPNTSHSHQTDLTLKASRTDQLYRIKHERCDLLNDSLIPGLLADRIPPPILLQCYTIGLLGVVHCSIVVRPPVPPACFPYPCARLIAGRVTTLWVKRPLSVSQQGRLSLTSLRGRLNE